MSNGNKNSITNVASFIYTIIATTKKKLPLFFIALHVYITNLVFKTDTIDETNVIIYLTLMGVFCMIWEFSFAIWATTQVTCLLYSKLGFAFVVANIRILNLAVISLFVTNGIPLLYVTPISSTNLTIVFSCIIVINYVIDLLQQKYYYGSWNKMYILETDKESEINTSIDQLFNLTSIPNTTNATNATNATNTPNTTTNNSILPITITV